MPPKIKVTKDEILDAAIDIVRQNGPAAINARTVARALNCSTQPVFSNFATMEALCQGVRDRAEQICAEYLRREEESGKYPVYKANGMAYIRFAKEERELFKLLYMCDRQDKSEPVDPELNDRMENLVHENTGLGGGKMKLFHLEMWAYVHGIATMYATGFMDLPWELVSQMLTDSYQGLRKQYEQE